MDDLINSVKYLTISDFSELSGISRKNLIYYDTIGIIKPVFTKENGYRYYSYAQLEEVSIVLALRDLDIPLKKIKNYLENISPDNLAELISQQKLKILDELNRLNQMNYIIEQRMSSMPISDSVNIRDIFIESCAEELLFFGQDVQYGVHSMDKDFNDFMSYTRSKKLVYGYPLGFSTLYDDIIGNRHGIYNYFYKIPSSIQVKKTIKPSGVYVIGYDNSYLAGDMTIFERLDAFIKHSGFSAKGRVYIENISDEILTKNPEKYLSKISVQVEKK